MSGCRHCALVFTQKCHPVILASRPWEKSCFQPACCCFLLKTHHNTLNHIQRSTTVWLGCSFSVLQWPFMGHEVPFWGHDVSKPWERIGCFDGHNNQRRLFWGLQLIKHIGECVWEWKFCDWVITGHKMRSKRIFAQTWYVSPTMMTCMSCYALIFKLTTHTLFTTIGKDVIEAINGFYIVILVVHRANFATSQQPTRPIDKISYFKALHIKTGSDCVS